MSCMCICVQSTTDEIGLNRGWESNGKSQVRGRRRPMVGGAGEVVGWGGSVAHVARRTSVT